METAEKEVAVIVWKKIELREGDGQQRPRRPFLSETT
jgi:hypothetical protein